MSCHGLWQLCTPYNQQLRYRAINYTMDMKETLPNYGYDTNKLNISLCLLVCLKNSSLYI